MLEYKRNLEKKNFKFVLCKFNFAERARSVSDQDQLH